MLQLLKYIADCGRMEAGSGEQEDFDKLTGKELVCREAENREEQGPGKVLASCYGMSNKFAII
jgi:hypothetical protein